MKCFDSEVFHHVVDGAKVIKVDPSSCIPFVQVRELVPSGVLRMKHSFESENEENVVGGAVAGGVLPTVVRLTGSLKFHVSGYFSREYDLNDAEAEEKAGAREEWFGVVDGQHRLSALLELQKECPRRWGRFRWCVMCLEGYTSMDVLRSFARSQNYKQVDTNFVETTLYDTLNGMQEEAERLGIRLGSRKPSAKELAESYIGCKGRTTSTMRQLASLALRLNVEVVSVIGEITNFESSELACTYYASRSREGLTPGTASTMVDCRVYRRFLTLSSLRQASTFLHSNNSNSDEARINALYRAREICRLNNFRAVSFQVMNEQFGKAVSAFREAAKFESMLQSSVWPRGMELMQQNLLQNTILDDEVEANEGNDTTVLPSLLQSLRRLCPQQAPMLEAKFQASCSAPSHEEDEINPILTQQNDNSADLRNRQETAQDETLGPNIAPSECDSERKKERGSRETIDEYELKVLQELGIAAFNMEWEAYNTIFQASPDSLFDLVLTEPPCGMTSSTRSLRSTAPETAKPKEMDEFVAFVQRVLLPGGYVLLFTPPRLFREWVKAFRANDFSCMEYPLVIANATDGLQRTNQQLFPQNVCEFAVMAISPGQNSKGFKANLSDPYHLITCPYKRKFAAITGVGTVKRKLKFKNSRAPVRSEEKNSDMLSELLVTFSPEGGRVLDPFGGTMTTAIACMETGRKGVVIEKDSECFRLALARLRSLSTLYRRNPNKRLQDQYPERQPDTISSVAEASSSSRDDLACGENIVSLLLDGEIIGSAVIHEDPTTDSGYRTTLHGHALSKYAKNDEELVVIWKAEIHEAWAKTCYPYNYGGPDGPIKTLGEMNSGFHAWDLKEMLGVP